MAEIKMDYELMAEMKEAFQRGAEDLDDSLHQVGNLAEMLESGGLIGEGGEAFSDALRGVLSNKIKMIRDKFEELARDIQHAVESMQDADSTSSGEMGM